MQTMELDRINEMEKFIQTYTNSIQILSETMNQVNN
jgi:prefoldin subunit 5